MVHPTAGDHPAQSFLWGGHALLLALAAVMPVPGFSRNRRCKPKGIRGRVGAGSKRQRTMAQWASPPSGQTGTYRMPSLYAGGIASSASRLTELIPILHRSAFELKCS